MLDVSFLKFRHDFAIYKVNYCIHIYDILYYIYESILMLGILKNIKREREIGR